jgi:serine/threonine protein kinase
MEADLTSQVSLDTNKDLLNDGSFGFVYTAMYESEPVAVKIIKQRNGVENEEFIKSFEFEVNQLKRLSHPNIIQLISHGTWNSKKCMILELSDVGSLYEVLYKRADLNYTINHAISWLYQLADAVNYMHSFKPRPIIHRDLKSQNLLLMSGGCVLKVCDFGTACDLKTLMTMETGTPFWIAPEVFSNRSYNEKCDVYSYMIIMWEMFVRKLPYFHLPSHLQNLFAVMFYVMKGGRVKKVASLPRLLELLFEQGIKQKSEARPSMKMILNFMKTLDSIINERILNPIFNTQVKELNEYYISKIHHDLTSIKEIQIINQGITKINPSTFEKLKDIEELSLSGNNIPTIKESIFNSYINEGFSNKLSSLKKLDLHENKLANIGRHAFRGLASLESLSLDRNLIFKIDPESFKGLKMLTDLSLEDNQIEHIEENSFSDLTSLKRLYLTNNKLTKFARYTFRGLSSLEKLDLSDNQIRTIDPESFEGLKMLIELSLEDNQIEHIEENSFSDLTSLKILLLTYNKLTNLNRNTFKGLVNLDGLVLHGNKIQTIDPGLFKDLKALTQLFLSFNQIENIDENLFSDLKSLSTLSLKHNKLTRIDRNTFRGLANLEVLKLKDNKIEAIDPELFNGLRMLYRLSLSNNQIEYIDEKVFSDLKNLKTLELTNNKLTSIDRNTFIGLVNLEVLKLKGNQIIYIDPDFISRLKVLEL